MTSEERERLRAKFTPEQLREYDELRASLRRAMLREFSGGVDAALAHQEAANEDVRDFLRGFQDALTAGDATVRFEESMAKEEDEAG